MHSLKMYNLKGLSIFFKVNLFPSVNIFHRLNFHRFYYKASIYGLSFYFLNISLNHAFIIVSVTLPKSL
jgi:hypothetical protein